MSDAQNGKLVFTKHTTKPPKTPTIQTKLFLTPQGPALSHVSRIRCEQKRKKAAGDQFTLEEEEEPDEEVEEDDGDDEEALKLLMSEEGEEVQDDSRFSFSILYQALSCSLKRSS